MLETRDISSFLAWLPPRFCLTLCLALLSTVQGKPAGRLRPLAKARRKPGPNNTGNISRTPSTAPGAQAGAHHPHGSIPPASEIMHIFSTTHISTAHALSIKLYLLKSYMDLQSESTGELKSQDWLELVRKGVVTCAVDEIFSEAEAGDVSSPATLACRALKDIVLSRVAPHPLDA
jgi:hypothetical protein